MKAIIALASSSLGNHDQATAAQIEQARRLAFSSLFLAAELMPDGFSEQFRQMVVQELKVDDSAAQKAQVRLLLHFHQFKDRQATEDVVLKKLQM